MSDMVRKIEYVFIKPNFMHCFPPSINFHLYEVCARGSLSGGCTLADNFNLVRTQGCHCQTCHSSNKVLGFHPCFVRQEQFTLEN